MKQSVNRVELGGLDDPDPYEETITTQEQEAVKVRTIRKYALSAEILGWNVLLYALSVVMMILLIEHGIFFYGWPLNMSVWVDVPFWLPFGYGALLYLLLKAWHYIEEMGIVFVDEPPIKKMEEDE